MNDTMKLQSYQTLKTPAGENLADACAQFMYKGYQISFSTNNYGRGGCANEVVVFSPNDAALYMGHSVEECVCYIDKSLV